MGDSRKTKKELLAELEELRARVAELEGGWNAVDPSPDELTTARVPEPAKEAFLKAQDYVREYFGSGARNPQRGTVEFSGERYILVRAASMSREFFEQVASLYRDRGEVAARAVANGFLFDMAHALGKADARAFHERMNVSDPMERLSAGPVHFAFSGWARVDILPESKPTPDEDFYLIYDHPYSFEVDAWLKRDEQTDFPVCVMNAGYSSGWCEESFGLPLVSVEVECLARGDQRCRFIMAPPSRIEEHLRRYGAEVPGSLPASGAAEIPEFFQRKRLEEAVKASEERWRSVVENAPNIILVLDREGLITYLNRTVSGMSVDDAIGKQHLDFVEPAYRQAASEVLDRVFSTGETGRYQVRGRGPDGRPAWYETRVGPVMRGEEVVGASLVVTDVTELKRSEEALRESEERWRRLVQSSPDAIIEVDFKGTITSVNEATERISGFSREELVGRNFTKVGALRLKDIPKYLEIFAKILVGKPPPLIEVEAVRKDGQPIWLEAHVSKLGKGSGSGFIQSVVRDISYRKRDEERLRESEEKYRSLVENISDIVVIVDREGRIQFINRTVPGMKVEDVLGTSQFDYIRPEYHDVMRRELKHVFSGGGGAGYEVRGDGPDGSEAWYSTKLSPIKSGEEVVAATLVVTDITDQKQVERHLRDQNRYNQLRAEIWKLAADESLSEAVLIQKLLNTLGPALGVARACFDKVDGEEMVCSFEWKLPEVRSSLGNSWPVELARAIPSFEYHELTMENAVEKLPPEMVTAVAPLIESLSRDFDIASLLLVPCHIAERLEGSITLDVTHSQESPPQWTEEEKQLVADMVQIISGTIAYRRSQEALRASEERFRAIFEGTSDSVFMKDAALRYTQVNPAMSELLGSSAEEITGVTDTDLFGEAGGIQIRTVDLRVLTGEVVEVKDHLPVGDGYRTFHVVKAPMRDYRGQVVGLCGIARDVTENERAAEAVREARNELEKRVVERTAELSRELQERTRAEEALRESEKRFRTLFESAAIGIAIAAPDGLFMQANESFRRMLGFELEELRSMSLVDLTYPEDREHAERLASEVAEGKRDSYHMEKRCLRKDGSFIWANLAASAVRDAYGRVQYWMAAVEDITIRRMAQEELEERHSELVRVNRELERLHRAKDEFVAMVSHELRTPLVTGLGYIELLLEGHLGPLSEEADSGMQVALRNLRRLSALIDDILSYSSLIRRDRRSGPVLSAVSPAELLGECREEFLVRSGRDGSCVRLELSPELPGVYADEDMIRRVISNLLDNAHRHAGDAAEIALSARRRGSGQVAFSVADNGPGMTSEVQATVFEPFVKLSGKREGAGLGLAIVRSVLEAHGSQPKLRSAAGEGTEISFELAVAEGASRGASGGTSRGATAAAGPRSGGARVLLVDDDEDTLELVRVALAGHDVSLDTVASAEEALPLLQDRSFDLVLLDMSLPGMDGADLCEQIKKRAATADTSVLMFSARAEEVARERAYRAGCDGYIVKPIVVKDFVATVESFLSGS